ncbi:hypothetical protein JR316_0003097 [Psilocybe cubensis]|uniref:Uncharacterized protein n=1 Tax=Psilocybe cubensis TaxID=181762 RepID=A0ACB8H7J6_PSICU|nr:hypothetical protein JR316_0003097 [Psilocybe cubensis]KAH9483627.1 hypothetical protein JR316_0003097 [Psilocybe cubensis]
MSANPKYAPGSKVVFIEEFIGPSNVQKAPKGQTADVVSSHVSQGKSHHYNQGDIVYVVKSHATGMNIVGVQEEYLEEVS